MYILAILWVNLEYMIHQSIAAFTKTYKNKNPGLRPSTKGGAFRANASGEVCNRLWEADKQVTSRRYCYRLVRRGTTRGV